MNTVSTVSIAGMAASLVLCLGLPAALCILLKRRTGAKLTDMLLGAVTFVLSALVLEQLLHLAVNALFGEALANNLWLYALYGGAAAAVFEECGRLAAMKCFLKKRLTKQSALMYGVGHGGIEAVLIGGVSCISNLSTALMVNNGALEATLSGLDEAARAATMEAVSQLCALPPYTFYLVGVERLLALALQLCLSYLVYRAVRYRRRGFFAAALGVHFAVDAGVVILSGFLPTLAVEAFLAAAIAAIAFFTVRAYRAETESAAAG